MKKGPDFVIVTWLDAWVDGTGAVTLKDVKETHKPELIQTAGWLLLNDEEGISIANELCSDGSYRGRTFILKGMIKSVTPFNLVKIRKQKPCLDSSSLPSLPSPS